MSFEVEHRVPAADTSSANAATSALSLENSSYRRPETARRARKFIIAGQVSAARVTGTDVAVALAQSLLVGPQNQRHVREAQHATPSASCGMICFGVFEMWSSPLTVRHPHLHIVGHNRECCVHDRPIAGSRSLRSPMRRTR
jgi:hypothetical protein